MRGFFIPGQDRESLACEPITWILSLVLQLVLRHRRLVLRHRQLELSLLRQLQRVLHRPLALQQVLRLQWQVRQRVQHLLLFYRKRPMLLRR
jgi:hypothetical protein